MQLQEYLRTLHLTAMYLDFDAVPDAVDRKYRLVYGTGYSCTFTLKFSRQYKFCCIAISKSIPLMRIILAGMLGLAVAFLTKESWSR